MIGDDELGDLFHHSEEETEEQEEAIPANEPANADTNNEEGVAETAVKPKRKVIRNPQLKLDPVRLCGNRGLPVVPDAFKNVKLQGKGKEREDVNQIIKVLEHWGHRLYPKLRFDDLLDKIEVLGKKKPVQTCLKKIRLDMPVNFDDEIVEETNNHEPDIPTNTDALFDTLHEGINEQQEQEIMYPNSPVFENAF